MQNEEKFTVNVSQTVKTRLPRYYRYLGKLIKEGTLRISSNELAGLMHVTASQIRQDLNCFGGFGHQGYGYNVRFLYNKIAEILGLDEHYKIVIIDEGNLGSSLTALARLRNRGDDIKALFDVTGARIGQSLVGVPILPKENFVEFCNREKIDIAVLAVPETGVEPAAELVRQTGIRGVLNFSSIHPDLPDNVAIEEVHLDDPLLLLCYDIKHASQDEGNKKQ